MILREEKGVSNQLKDGDYKFLPFFSLGNSFMTIPLHKLEYGLKCISDHGLIYTGKLLLEKLRQRWDIGDKKAGVQWADCRCDFTVGAKEETAKPDIIVALAGDHASIKRINITIKSLQNQALKADKIILWLMKNDFPQGQSALPKKLRQLIDHGLSLIWCESFEVSNSLATLFSAYPHSIIVVAAKNMYYSQSWLANLITTYNRENGNFVCCYTGFGLKKITAKEFEIEPGAYYYPSYLNVPFCCSGVVFPQNFTIFLQKEAAELKTGDGGSANIALWLLALAKPSKILAIKEYWAAELYDREKKELFETLGSLEFSEKLGFSDKSRQTNLPDNLATLLLKESKLMEQIAEARQVADQNKDESYYSHLASSSYLPELLLWYQRQTNEFLDLDQPQSLHEKTQWLKLYDSTELKTQLADKYRVRDWVAEKVGAQYLVPLLGVWSSFSAINFADLPDKFVLKTNHGSTWNIIVTDKSQLDLVVAQEKIEGWLKRNFAFVNGLELHYKNIKPLVLAESYIENSLIEYRFYCFAGQPKYIWLDGERNSNYHVSVFDLQWNYLPDFVDFKAPASLPEKPKKLQEMLDIVTVLCAEFAHVRVDLYYVEEKIYFGEMTFTQNSGIRKKITKKYARIMGDLITLPTKNVGKDTAIN